MLIYLAHTGATHQREYIAELLWDSSSTKQALTNLRTALTRLRQQVDEALIVTRKTLALETQSQQQVDSAILLHTLSKIGQIDSADKAAAIQKALETYQDEFLADFYLTDAPRFEDWVLTTRRQIYTQVAAAYEKLGQYALFVGDSDLGVAIARRWLETDALNEAAHTLLIRLLIEKGNVQEAMTHYSHAATLLKEELDVEPPAEMRALIEAARPKPVYIARPTNFVRHNLPVAHDQFFGRKAAQEAIHTRLDQPWCRLVTITGQGAWANAPGHHHCSQPPEPISRWRLAGRVGKC